MWKKCEQNVNKMWTACVHDPPWSSSMPAGSLPWCAMSFSFVAIYSKRWKGPHFCLVCTALGGSGAICCCYLQWLVRGRSTFVAIYMTWWTWVHFLQLFTMVGDHQSTKHNKTAVKTDGLTDFPCFWHPPKTIISLPCAMKSLFCWGCPKHEKNAKP